MEISTGIIPGISSEIHQKSQTRILVTIVALLLLVIPAGISPDILADIHAEKLSDVPSRISPCIFLEISSRFPSRIL